MFGAGAVISTAIVEMVGDNAKLIRSIDDSKKVVEDSTEEMTSGMEAFGKSMASAGETATRKLSPAFLVLAATFQKTFDTFDRGVDSMRAQTGLAGEALDGLTESMKRVGGQVTQSLDLVGEVMGKIYARTKLTGPALEALTTTILELSRITRIDAVAAVDEVTKMFEIWNIKTKDQVAVLNQLFRASQTTGIGFDVLTRAATDFGTQLQQLGFSFTGSIALISSLERSGIQLSVAMKAVNTALGNMAAQGVTDLDGAFADLLARIDGAKSKSEAVGIAVEAFGKRAGPLLAQAIRRGALEVANLTDEIANGSDTIKKAHDDSLDWSDVLAKLRNSVTALLGPVAQQAAAFFTIAAGMGPMIHGIGLLTSAIGGLTLASITNSTVVVAMGVAWFNLVAIAGSVAAAIGILTVAITAVVGAVYAWIQAYQAWKFANEEHQKSVEASGNFLDAYAKNVALGVHSMEEWREKIKQVMADESLSADEKAALKEQSDALTLSLKNGTLAAEAETEQTERLADAHRKAKEEARGQWAAELALADGLLGIQGAAIGARDAQRAYGDAQAKVDRLIEHGKRGTQKYREAVRELRSAELNAVQSQGSLEEAVVSYFDELASGGATQAEAIAQIKEWADKAGLSRSATRDLIAAIKDHIKTLNEIPTRVQTQIDADTSAATTHLASLRAMLNGLPNTTVTRVVVQQVEEETTRSGKTPIAKGGIIRGASGFITRGPTYLVGESTRSTFAGRGAEAVLPLDDRGIRILAKALALANGQRSDGGGDRMSQAIVDALGGRASTREVVKAITEGFREVARHTARMGV